MPRAKKRPNPKAGSWQYKAGLRPHTVVAYERSDKGNAVWIRWARRGTGRYNTMSLGLRLRDEHGRLLPERVAAAEQAARDAYNALLAGQDPRQPPQIERDVEAPLTIAEGLAMALRVPDGMYPVDNEHVRDMRRYEKHVLANLPSQVSTWTQITTLTYQQLWRKIAYWRVEKGLRTRTGEIQGKRAAELAVILLAQVGRWLKYGGWLSTTPDEPQRDWQAKFSADWAKITGDRPMPAHRPRHSDVELGKLFGAIARGKGDPRVRHAVLVGGEARLGQVIRCDRTCLALDGSGAYGLGRFTIPDTGKKKGATIDLDRAMRDAWDRALEIGYLSLLEASFQSGEIKTYPLFPSGRLVRGRARATRRKPLTDSAALDLFHELEMLAGIRIVDGRGWYGIRRIAADLAEDVEKDGRVLNSITGHTRDETRRLIYQDKERDELFAKAAITRGKARQLAMDAAEHEATVAMIEAQSQWETAREKRTARRAAAHAPRRPEGHPRQVPTYAIKSCVNCGSEFQPTGANSKACASCSPRRVRPPRTSDKSEDKPTPEPTPAVPTRG
jgi:hypothetical protein